MRRALTFSLLILSAGINIHLTAAQSPGIPQSVSNTTSSISADDPLARQKLQGLLASYVRSDGSDWNVTLQLNVTEPANGQVAETVRLIGASNLRRELTRNGQSVVSTFSQGSGTLTRDGVQETIPAWSLQSLHSPEFPFPTIVARLLDVGTLVTFDSADSSEYVHIKLTKPTLDQRGKRIPVAEKVFETDFYFDPNTGLLMKERYWIFSPSSMTNNAQVEVTYSNYQPVSGLKLPFRITKRLGGVLLSDTLVQSIDLNANNLNTLF